MVRVFHLSKLKALTSICQGPVFFLELLGRPVLVINSVEAARDLMEKKGANFSDRPRSPVFNM